MFCFAYCNKILHENLQQYIANERTSRDVQDSTNLTARSHLQPVLKTFFAQPRHRK